MATSSESASALSLFTGAGGLDLGLEAAGFDSIGCVELDETCRATLEHNRPSWKVLERDVRRAAIDLSPEKLGLKQGELGLLAGGPPCQPFSMAGQWSRRGRRGMLDKRADTVLAMLDLVEVFFPRALLIENVAGFLRGKVSAKAFVEERLAEINVRHDVCYKLSAHVINAADYGVPQSRLRIIAIATRDGTTLEPPPPTHAGNPLTAWDALHDLAEEGTRQANGYWVGLLPSIPEGMNYQYLTSRGDGEEVFGYRTRYWSFLLKLAKNRPSWTLPAMPGPATGPFHWDNRPLTIRERLRLQTFPDTWSLVGTDREQVKQVGNATPPLLGEIYGRYLQEVLFGASFEDGPTFLGSRALSPAPPATPPIKIPNEYRSHIGPKKPHPGEGLGPGSTLR